jgi:hypothetical protein
MSSQSAMRSATASGGRYRRRIGRAPGPTGDQGRYPVHHHDATASQLRLAVIDRNLDWVASCYGMR